MMRNPLRDDRSARMGVCCVVEAGDVAVAELLSAVGAPAVWEAIIGGAFGEPMAARARQVDLDRVVAATDQCSARFLIPGDDEWPESLEDLDHGQSVQRRGGCPPGIWARGPGHLATRCDRSVAIVGSRASTAYGSGVAADLASDLADRGVTVISGGAYGIDAAAHRGALAVQGSTIAVLACGVNIPYPRGNEKLFDWIVQDHLLVSELPPGERPSRMRFLSRNRLIAAMARGVVVVEAAVRSGARNTATWAIECGRPLMAVPGPVHSALSVTPHELVRQGQAVLVTRSEEVLELVSSMGENTVEVTRGADRPTDGLEPRRLAVFEAVPARGGGSVGDIALRAGVSIPVCLGELAALEAEGLVAAHAAGWRAVRADPDHVAG